MPVVTVQLVEGNSVENKRKMAQGITEALTPFMNNKPEAIWVVFQEVAFESWARGGTLVSDDRGFMEELAAGS